MCPNVFLQGHWPDRIRVTLVASFHFNYLTKGSISRDFPCSPGVENLPVSAGIQPRSGKIPCAVGQLSPGTTTTEPTRSAWSPGSTTREATEMRSQHTATRESPRVAMKTQQGQNIYLSIYLSIYIYIYISISKYSHSLRSWGLRLQHVNL